MYGTEDGVGQALKVLFEEKGYKRGDLYVTTKVNSDQYTYEKVGQTIMIDFRPLFIKFGLDSFRTYFREWLAHVHCSLHIYSLDQL